MTDKITTVNERIQAYLSSNKVFVVVVTFLYALPLFTKDETSPVRSLLYILTLILIFSLLAMSFDLQLGRAGLLNFGQAALFGVGAYAIAFNLIPEILAPLSDLPFPVSYMGSMIRLFFAIPYPISIIIAILIGVLLGGIMGSTTNRLKGTGFAFIALAIAMLIFNFFSTNTDLSGGETGLPISTPPILRNSIIYVFFVLLALVIFLACIVMVISYFSEKLLVDPFDFDKVGEILAGKKRLGITVLKLVTVIIGLAILLLAVAGNILDLYSTSDSFYRTIPIQYYLALTSVVLSYLFIKRLTNSQFGRIIVAIAQNEERVEALGYNVYKYKILAVGIAGGIAALGGALYAPFIRIIGPHSAFGVEIAIDAMIYTIVGGLGTIIGPILGTGIVVYSELRLVEFIGEWWLILLGIIYILIVLFFPRGIVGSLQLKSRTLKEQLRKLRVYETDYWIYALLGCIIIFIALLVTI